MSVLHKMLGFEDSGLGLAFQGWHLIVHLCTPQSIGGFLGLKVVRFNVWDFV